MRFCDRCETSIPNTAKQIHTRHNEWLCAPCHDKEVLELKERAEAHLRERQEHPKGAARNSTLWSLVGVGVIAIISVAWVLHEKNAEALSADEARAGYLEWRHGAEIEKQRALSESAREDSERALSERRAEGIKATADDVTFQSFERMVRQELKLQTTLIENPCALMEGNSLILVATAEWHDLAAEEQIEVAETVDRVVTAVFKGERNWSFMDGPFAVGGRRADGIWSSRFDYDESRT